MRRPRVTFWRVFALVALITIAGFVLDLAAGCDPTPPAESSWGSR